MQSENLPRWPRIAKAPWTRFPVRQLFESIAGRMKQRSHSESHSQPIAAAKDRVEFSRRVFGFFVQPILQTA